MRHDTTPRVGGGRLSTIVLATLALAVTLSATAAARHTATTLTVRTATWLNLDIQATGVSTVSPYWFAGYDRLVALGPNGQVVPYLAKSWDVTPTSITFHMRSDAKCVDGTKVTPLVVVQSFNRFLTVPKSLNQLPSLFGPGPYHLKANRYANTFTFSTDTPNRNMLFGFTTGYASIICPAGLKALASDPNALQTQMFGSGPYTMSAYVPGDHVSFQKRKDWKWGMPASNPGLMPDTINFQVVSDDTTASNLLLTGGLNLSTVAGPDVIRMVKASQSHQVKFKPAKNFQTFGLAFNMSPGRPVTNVALRHAIFLAIDTHQAAAASWPGANVWSPSFFVPGATCYDKATRDLLPKPSLAAAQQVLTSAGYKYSGGNLLDPSGNQVTLRLIASASQIPGTDFMADQIRKLGINLDYLFTATSSFTQSYLARNFDITTAGRQLGYDAPGANILLFAGPLPPVGSNTPAVGFGDDAYANAASQGLQTLGKTSCDNFDKVQQLQLKNYYWLPIGAPVVDWFATNSVTRFLATGTGYVEPYYLEMKS